MFPYPKLSVWAFRPDGRGRGYSCGKLAEVAGSSRESGKNDIKPGKCRPDGGLEPALGGERERMRENEGGRGGPEAEKGKRAGERAQEVALRKLRTFTTIPSFLHPQILLRAY